MIHAAPNNEAGKERELTDQRVLEGRRQAGIRDNFYLPIDWGRISDRSLGVKTLNVGLLLDCTPAGRYSRTFKG
jgi:hypothetical protein